MFESRSTAVGIVDNAWRSEDSMKMADSMQNGTLREPVREPVQGDLEASANRTGRPLTCGLTGGNSGILH